MKQFLMILLIVFSPAINAKSLKVAFGEDRPPYIFEENKILRGIEFDIVKEALLLSGYTITYDRLPTKRLDTATSKMDYDLAVGVLDQLPELFYSSDYMQVKNYAIAKSSRGLRLATIEDLAHYSVGAWPSAWSHCGDVYKKMFAPDSHGKFSDKYYEPLTSESQNKMFWLGRFEISISSKVTFQYYKKALASTLHTDLDVTFYDLIHNDAKFKVAFRNEKVRNDFENGLSQLKRNKRYLRIFQYYTR